ncbi:MAG: transcription antitermination factor NusB [Alphaproteobacteria bacterium]
MDDVLRQVARDDNLAPRDRAFARLLVVTLFRRLGQVDAVIDSFLRNPTELKPAMARDILRLGTVQLLFLGTAPHAAVGTSVQLAGSIARGRLKGLINAVLRRVAEEGPALLENQDPVALNLPDWLVKGWRDAYGKKQARRMALASLEPPALDITVKTNPDFWAARLQADQLPTQSLRRPVGGMVHELAGYPEGAWWVQDAAAALPVKLFGPVKGKRVIDLCAAPGGKAMQLAAARANVTALDRSESRMEALRENIERLRLPAELVCTDLLSYSPAEEYDCVLLDAPCSATGTLRRQPDAIHLKSRGQIDRLVGMQRRMLDKAISLARVGGLVVYCTCSLEPQEGEKQIDRLLDKRDDVELVPVTADEFPALVPFINDQGTLRTLPSHWAERGGMDGFFAARLRRIA